jgi:hypothetical protein
VDDEVLGGGVGGIRGVDRECVGAVDDDVAEVDGGGSDNDDDVVDAIGVDGAPTPVPCPGEDVLQAASVSAASMTAIRGRRCTGSLPSRRAGPKLPQVDHESAEAARVPP